MRSVGLYYKVIFEGRMTRICLLHSKLAPPRWLDHTWGAHAWDLAPGRYLFMMFMFMILFLWWPVRCYWLQAAHPLPKGWHPETSQTQQMGLCLGCFSQYSLDFYSCSLINLLKYLYTVSSYCPDGINSELIKMLICLSVIIVHSQQLSFGSNGWFPEFFCPRFCLSDNIHTASW